MSHEHPAHEHRTDEHREPADASAFWESRYGERSRIWSGNANRALIDTVNGLTHGTGLAPGTALDLGSGEGGDSLWLAEQGWRVTGIDISPTALARAADEADARGIPADRLTWQHHDLVDWHPGAEERYDLVSACFLHAPVEVAFPREDVLRRAAGAVAPGGHLLVVGHAGIPPWASEHHHDDTELPTNAQVLDALALDPALWTTIVDENRPRRATAPDGTVVDIDDAVLLLRRTA
ncbi:class I SAM-dependent methyltransferase [Herbiconiux sp.]|uniref:class I SAM-dependent methyltransferase n=1 Tax=Herbiconiux sp. TaxID=1871186 RepID=UPI0025BBEBA7|nr:class I SAM-dependent methyltransferase [Herbiconiux sp.]